MSAFFWLLISFPFFLLVRGRLVDYLELVAPSEKEPETT